MKEPSISSARTPWYWLELDWQTRLVRARADGSLSREVVLCLEHWPVFTLGNRGGAEHLHVTPDFLRQNNIDLVETGRGGSITYHGPGQLVIYPIVNLAANGWGVRDFVHALESVMISLAARWDLTARRDEAHRGVWIGHRKIGSVGLRLHRQISFHGLALNVKMDLTPFSWITACGLPGIQMTSLANEIEETISIANVRQAARQDWDKIFHIQTEAVSAAWLEKYMEREQLAATIP